MSASDSTERYRSIVETAVDAIVTIDERGIIDSVNPATERLFGYAASEMAGRNVSMLMPEPHASAHDGYLARYLAGGERRIIGIGREVTARRKDGSTFPVHLAVGQMEVGGRVMFTGVIRDITDLRVAEQQLAAERDAQRLKDEFLAMVSHELRTPLAAVVGYLELAIADVSDPGVRELLEVAERNGRRLTALVRDILLVAQADAGRLSLDMRPVALGDLVSQAVLAARPSAGAKDVLLEDSVGANPTMRADPDRLGQVLDNLISNAIKFSPSGGRVRVTLESAASWVRIAVADDGPGIAPDDLGRLFEPFYRAHRSGPDAVPGSGLGLAVVKAIAEAHGGTVGVDTELGRGSTFSAELPLESVERPFAPVGAR